MEKPKFISTPAIFEKIETRKDSSYKVTIGTPEMPPEESGILLALANKEGYVYFSPKALNEDQLVVPEVAPEFKGEKSPSERLRARLFVYFTEHLRKPKADFHLWYIQEVERIGQAYLDKMN